MENNGSGSILQDSSAYDSLIGETIANNFRLVKRIGSGAMGRVYQAEQLSLGKMVAIKILRHELMADEKLLRRFELEARTASAVSHPNLVETFDCGRDKTLDLAYIAMELLQGPDLAQVIAREAPISLQRSARIIDQVLAALEEAHAAGIIHRDLKPGNIILIQRRDEADFVKVCDFGIAKVKSLRAATRPNLTMAGFVFGTPEYMSPEQACGAEVDARTDLYAVAAMLYYLVSGELPFPAPSPTEVLARILRDEPERPSSRGYVTVPLPIEDLIMRGLEKNPEKRPQSASEFRVLLRDAWDGIIDYWPGQNNGPPTLSLRAPTPSAMPHVSTSPDRSKTPSISTSPGGSAPSAPYVPSPPSLMRPPSGPGSAPAPGRAAAPPAVPMQSRVINWGALRRRRPNKAATLGFMVALACGGAALFVFYRGGHGGSGTSPASGTPQVQVEAWSSSSQSSPSSPGGMIVVPSDGNERSGGSDEHHGSASHGGGAPGRQAYAHPPQRVVAHGKGHQPEPRGAVNVAASGKDNAVAMGGHLAPSAGSSAPGLEPATPEAPAEPVAAAPARVEPTSAAPTGKVAPGTVLHKLRATSIPSEAEVALDGKVVGRTPLFGTEIDISQAHTLTIRKDGYAPFEQVINASSAWVLRPSDNAASLRVAPVLKKADRAVASSSGSAHDDGRINAGAPATASPAVLAATSYKLRITSIPSEGEVFLDGKSLGRTPLFGADIDMSRSHRLVIRKQGYAAYEQTVTTTSDWSIKPSDRSSALLRISALLRQGDSLAQSPAGGP
jgi:serine/threonine protein kinase